MSFTIICDKCGSVLQVKDKGYYPSEKTIDLFPYSERDECGFPLTYNLNIYCKNEDCENEVKIKC